MKILHSFNFKRSNCLTVKNILKLNLEIKYRPYVAVILLILIFFVIIGSFTFNNMFQVLHRKYLLSCCLYSQSYEDYILYKRYFSNPKKYSGKYIELGALDGIRYSNTKFFQDNFNWDGVLIEPEPKNFKKLVNNRPNDKVYNFAICNKKANEERFIKFTGDGAIGGIIDKFSDQHIKQFNLNVSEYIRIPCKPMSEILEESGISKFDFLSLDVEGAEMEVLNSIDWSKISIRLIIVEVLEAPENRINIKNKLLSVGYKLENINFSEYCPSDYLPYRSDIFINHNF